MHAKQFYLKVVRNPCPGIKYSQKIFILSLTQLSDSKIRTFFLYTRKRPEG
jgi:hypothetical protein